MTSVGPHRDDFKLILESQSAGAMYLQEAKAFGSQGQQRTIALALKLGELELIRETTGKTPIVLLDDVFSELDEERSSFLFNLLGRLSAQTFITSTRQEAWVPELGDCRVFTVHDGQVN
jgi:DNA replication and repair protein RecF